MRRPSLVQCSTLCGTYGAHLCLRGCVANPRDTTGYRYGLRLATKANPLPHKHRIASNTALALLAIAWPCIASAHSPLTEVEAGASHEHLTGGREAWRSVYLQASGRIAAHAFELGVRGTNRFGLDDTELSVAGTAALPQGWSVSGGLAGSTTHRILPRWAAQAAVQHGLAAGLGGSLQWRRTLYGPDDSGPTRGSTALGIGLEWYAGPLRLAWNGSHSRLDVGADANAQWAQLDRYYGEQASGQVSRVGLLVSAGHEIENLPVTGPTVTRVRGVGLTPAGA